MKRMPVRLLQGALAGAAALSTVLSSAAAASAAPPAAPSPPPLPTAPAKGVQQHWRQQPPPDESRSCATIKQRATTAGRTMRAGSLMSCADFVTMATKSAIGLDPDLGDDPLPSGCGVIGSKIVERGVDCQRGVIFYELWTTPKPPEVPKLVGTATIVVDSVDKLGWKAPNFNRTVKIQMVEATGRALAGIKVGADVDCFGSGCTLDYVSGGAVTDLALKVPLHGYAQFHSSPPASSKPADALSHYMQTTINLRHVNESDPNPYKASHESEWVRCDKRPPTENPNSPNDAGGCVFPDLVPTYTLSKSTGSATQTAAHIERAQEATLNHWGRYTGATTDKALTRLVNEAQATKNRNAACAAAPDPRPTGKDCDEYPFAATYQGAALEGRGDFHWELIDSSDNRAEGAYRKQWYLENRVIDEDPFWVKIVP
ncbi:NucA/NucB deoxyribonuclease domain-containing protein [Actinomadura bangladeshensis]|uniref:Deoxyribonuclease NucA/NucB domain-containing protein n=1 Tax=Actinomadura bangladeshensis TaxID=453573 RepID=A0A6L9QGH3_9ACTN|nr:hypothetical protein [Actinomadura bangladeshensis]NEA24580.1 hypothetical protein [Actinomadura bangladeshensis]